VARRLTEIKRQKERKKEKELGRVKIERRKAERARETERREKGRKEKKEWAYGTEFESKKKEVKSRWQSHAQGTIPRAKPGEHCFFGNTQDTGHCCQTL
jgi:hypothetical protein